MTIGPAILRRVHGSHWPPVSGRVSPCAPQGHGASEGDEQDVDG